MLSEENDSAESTTDQTDEDAVQVDKKSKETAAEETNIKTKKKVSFSDTPNDATPKQDEYIRGGYSLRRRKTNEQ